MTLSPFSSRYFSNLGNNFPAATTEHPAPIPKPPNLTMQCAGPQRRNLANKTIRKTWKQICSCSAHSSWAALMVIAKNSSRCHFTTSCMLQRGHIGGWEVGWESFWREAGLAGKWHPMGWIIDNFKPTQIITLLTTRYLQYLLARKECSNI